MSSIVTALSVWSIVCLAPTRDGQDAPNAPNTPVPEIRTWRDSGPPASHVDILFVGDGYPVRDQRKLWTDVTRYSKRLFKEPPFSWYEDRFNVRAMMLVSKDAGCRKSPADHSVHTPLDTHFDSDSGRLLTFDGANELERLVRAAGEVDIVFVMVNTERYGGAGTVLRSVSVRSRPLPAPTFAAQDTTSFLIAIHELGHSFSDLADEYVDPGVAGNYAMPDQGDLEDANVTLSRCVDVTSRDAFKKSVKWAHFFELPGGDKPPWQFEGGYYRAKGVIRPWATCMMRAHGEPFCPVCCEEMTKSILAACGETFDDAAYHKARPLKLWK